MVPTSPGGKNIKNSGLSNTQELAAIETAWGPQLPESIRAGVLALIQTAAGKPMQEPTR